MLSVFWVVGLGLRVEVYSPEFGELTTGSMRRDLPADLGGDDEFIMEHAGQGDLSLPHSGCPATLKFHRTQCIY